MLGSIQMCGVRISTVEVNDICESLQSHNVRLLSLRECISSDKDFKKLMKSVGKCKSILQMNLNLGLVGSIGRVDCLCQALEKNRSLSTLTLHGSPLGDEGVITLVEALASHPNIICLDVGDCQIGDQGLQYIADLLPPDGAKPGLEELTLSINPGITTKGWVQFFIALAASNTLRALYLDYNGIGDCGAGCLAVALAASSTLQTLDLEATGITEFGAKVFLHLLTNYPVPLKQLILTENRLHKETIDAINISLGETDDEKDSSDSHSTSSKTTTSASSSSAVSKNSSRRSSTSTLKGSEAASVSSKKSAVSKSNGSVNDLVVPVEQMMSENSEATETNGEIVTEEGDGGNDSKPLVSGGWDEVDEKLVSNGDHDVK